MKKENARQRTVVHDSVKEVTFPVGYDESTNATYPNPTLQEVIRSAQKQFPKTPFENLELRIEADPVQGEVTLILIPRQ